MNTNKLRILGTMLLLIIFTFLTACAGTTINVMADGTPIPKNINRLSNPETGITATVSFVRQFIYTEGKESIAMPEYLPLGELYVVDKTETKALLMAIHIYNPKKVEYQMWESHMFWYPDSQWPTHVQKCFYQGSMSTRDYRVTLPITDISRASSRVELRNSETGSVVMSLGDAIYRLKGGTDR